MVISTLSYIEVLVITLLSLNAVSTCYLQTIEDLEERVKSAEIEIVVRTSFLTEPANAVHNLKVSVEGRSTCIVGKFTGIVGKICKKMATCGTLFIYDVSSKLPCVGLTLELFKQCVGSFTFFD